MFVYTLVLLITSLTLNAQEQEGALANGANEQATQNLFASMFSSDDKKGAESQGKSQGAGSDQDSDDASSSDDVASEGLANDSLTNDSLTNDSLASDDSVSLSNEETVDKERTVADDQEDVDASEQDAVVLEPTEQEDAQESQDDLESTVPEQPAELISSEDDAFEPEEPEGIDTVNIDEPEGNWLFKRIWWEKSKDLFGKIREKVDQVVESRMHFYTERTRLDRDFLDPFFLRIGFDQGELSESISHLLEHLEKEREGDDLLDEEQLEYYNTLLEEKVTLEQLSGSTQGVSQLNNDMNLALNKLIEQINLARSYERQAWQLLNDIAEELNDKHAREHYYEIVSLWRNVKEIGNYIQGVYAQHFMQLAGMIVQKSQEIDQALNQLKDKGIDLKERIELQTPEVDEDLEVDEDVDDEEEPAGWFGWFGQKLAALF